MDSSPLLGVDELIIRSLKYMSSAQEESRLSSWRKASPANERYFQGVAHVWAVTASGADFGGDETGRPAAEDILCRAIGPERMQPLLVGGGGARRLLWWSTAAAAVAGLCVGFSWSGLFPRGTPAESLALMPDWGATEYVTGAEEGVTVRLADGSIVRMGPSSRLRLTGREGVREMFLEGQAFFGVAKRADFPFVVRTAVGEAYALGTRFDLRIVNGVLRVLVVEGSVAVRVREEEVRVNEGEMTLTLSEETPSVVQVTDVYALLDWMGQSLVFQDTPMDRAMQEIERLYGVNIHLDEAALSSRTITAWFTDQPFEGVMAVVCRAVQVKCLIGNASAIVTALEYVNP